MTRDRTEEDCRFMALALEEAEKAAGLGEVPVGAVIAGENGEVLALAHNLTVSENDPTAHAEIVAVRAAAKKIGNYRLTGTTLYVTVEPCPMCAGALVWARVDRLVYGTADPKAGAAGTLYTIPSDERLNHRVAVTSNIMEEESRAILQRFFRDRRGKSESP